MNNLQNLPTSPSGVQSDSLASLIHFEITKDTGEAIGPQSVNTPFNIKITAKDGNGNVVTSINGNLSLSTSLGETISPPLMQSGVAYVNDVRLYSPGNMTINAVLKGYYGSSLPFDVGGAMNSASITGKVVNGAGGSWVGATVHLENWGATALTTFTDAAGKYAFANLAPGTYTLWAEDNTLGNRSIDHSVHLRDGTPAVQNIEVSNAPCNPTTRTPVLLVPGIMGSSVGWGGPYPLLSKTPPNWKEFPKKTSSWGLHDPDKVAGWRDLVEFLEIKGPLGYGYQMGCTIFPVPYDWRMDINDAAREYLKKWIDEAKRVAGTSNVNVIAHSMGGLVTRAYIQSDGADNVPKFENDIDRFAMVGTPNHGSALTYYLVAGGDPVMADNVAFKTNPDLLSPFVKFYQRTAWTLYYTYHLLPLATEMTYAYNLQMYKLFDDHVPSATQLLPTYGFLNSGRELEYKKNEFLPKLNSADTIDRMGSSTGKVITRLFAGNGAKTTLQNITTGPKASFSSLYKDGAPFSSLLTSEANGDGTVLRTSATLGVDSVDNSADESETKASHAKLIGAYKEAIAAFIANDEVSSSASKAVATKSVRRATAEEPAATNEVGVMLFGRARILVTDGQGLRSGIEPTSGEYLDEIPNSAVVMDEEKATVSFPNAADGAYTLTIKSAFAEDYRLTVSYLDAGAADQKEYSGFNNANTTSFTFTVNSAAADKITINRTPLPPISLQADAIESGGLMTKLT